MSKSLALGDSYPCAVFYCVSLLPLSFTCSLLYPLALVLSLPLTWSFCPSTTPLHLPPSGFTSSPLLLVLFAFRLLISILLFSRSFTPLYHSRYLLLSLASLLSSVVSLVGVPPNSPPPTLYPFLPYSAFSLTLSCSSCPFSGFSFFCACMRCASVIFLSNSLLPILPLSLVYAIAYF